MWKIIIITCPNRKNALTIDKRVNFLQKQGLFSNEVIISCINDPDQAIGSGGATLNALLTAVELLSAKDKSVANVEVLKNSFVLILHMGRQYPFDIAGKAFSMLPIRNSSTEQLMTNFELLYDLITNKIAKNSDPGVYICSTDMTLITPNDETLSIRNSSICVLSCLATKEIILKHGLYDYYEDGKQKFVKNIHFHGNDQLLKNVSNRNGLFALVNGIVYFNYEVASTLYNISINPPISCVTYHGSDNQEAPLVLSLFFDLLLPCCKDVKKDDFVEGLFSSNLFYNLNQKELISKSRITLWNSLKSFKVNLMMFSEETKYIYYDCDSIDQRKLLFAELAQLKNFENDFQILETNIESENGKSIIFNSVLKDNLTVKIGNDVVIMNSEFNNNNNLVIGNNCFLNDLTISNCTIKIPNNTFIQKININFEALKYPIPILIAFGMQDNLKTPFNNNRWTIMNRNWMEFSKETQITENDLWEARIEDKSKRTLLNAKLYIWLDPLSELQTNDIFNQLHMSLFTKDIFQLNIWRRCIRYSLEDIMLIADLDKTFEKRSKIDDKIKINIFIANVCRNKPMNFLASIRYHILDGSVDDLLKGLDAAALENKNDLCILPRIMAFICSILLELSGDLRVLKTGPRSNISWVNTYNMIENNRIEGALIEMTRLRKEWSVRPDLILRASRHYEGAMQCFIRLAVITCSKWVDIKHQNQIPLNLAQNNSFEWIKVTSPARLDLAGAWSDTPPICYECEGSCVTNVAIFIDSGNPIGTKARILPKKQNECLNHIKIVMKESADENETDIKLYFNDLSDFKDYNKPLVAGCLMKAVFIFTKLVELDSKDSLDQQLEKKIAGSLELQTWTNLPHGSGLGTSSILIGCVLTAVWKLMNIEVSSKELIYSVLLVEQMMTTGGGWQDQCGGLLGGFRLTKCKQSLPLEIDFESLQFPVEFEQLFNERLLLVYTGVTRLAKDLLLTALRNWYAISKEICENLRGLVTNGNKCAEAIRNGRLDVLGECINNHRQHKLTMAPGSIPKEVNDLILLLTPVCYGMALAGAGGGGFLYILTKEPNIKAQVQDIIDSTGYHMKLYDAKLAKSGITVEYI